MDYRSMVNPTYLTAKSTLYMLAGAGNEDAQRVIAALGTQNELIQNRRKENGQKLPMPESEAKALMAGTSLAVEARYEALSRYMRREGCRALLDIACGYAPRSLYCDKAGISYSSQDDTLLCIVSGRVDTISAPALLEVFEKNYEGISRIRIDAGKLEYISSAGLRVLLMAVKKLGEGSVTVIHASEPVREIFETTGFDQMIAVE